MDTLTQLNSHGSRRWAAWFATPAIAVCLSALGCATGPWVDEPLADRRMGSAIRTDDDDSSSSPGFLTGLFVGVGSDDHAEKSEIAQAAQKDPFPTAAEALGY